MRSLILAGALFVAAPAFAQTTYYCVPAEPRVTARDRLVSVEVRVEANGQFGGVVYRAANGATYDRAAQYSTKNTFFNGQRVWVGTLRINRNVGMRGSLVREGGRLFYVETVHDLLQGGNIVSRVVSACNDPTPEIPSAALLRDQASEERAAQMRAEADRLDAERKEQQARVEKVALLEKSRDLIRDKMLGCIGREGASMVLTDEKAEVVAKAAMIFCQSDVDAWVRSSIEIAAAENGRASDSQALHDGMEKTALDVITAYVVKARGEIIRKNLSTPQSSPAPSPDAKPGPPA